MEDTDLLISLQARVWVAWRSKWFRKDWRIGLSGFISRLGYLDLFLNPRTHFLMQTVTQTVTVDRLKMFNFVRYSNNSSTVNHFIAM